MKTTTLPLRNSRNRSPLRAFLLIPFVLVCFVLSPQARAVCQEGCLTNFNTALGDDALINNTTGPGNTAIGSGALFSNTSGDNNTATGFNALDSNTTGGANTATGVNALQSNTTGVNNTATGVAALFLNTTGGGNTATGIAVLENNTTGSNNTATGIDALFSNTIGNYNIANGQASLFSNTTGNNNIALGFEAGINLTTGNFNIDIGNAGVAGESKTIRIGTRGAQRNTFIAGISGVTVANGVGVIIDNNGHLGTVVSSARFKGEIKPMDKASEAVLALKPVSFRYKQELDPDGIPQFGLVAEQVEKVNPDLVARDAYGKPYTVRYEAVNAMLLNEFLKEHRTVKKQQATIAQLKAADAKQEEKISALTELVKAQAAQIQKVSAQLEVNKTASQIVLNNQ
jgi:trimeric autotransporter adhesin